MAHGFIVLVGSRNLERGEAAAKTIDGDARELQLDVTDPASIAAAAERIRNELGRLDVLVNNAAISNTSMRLGESVEEYSRSTRASNVSLDEVRAVWETNVFGVLAVTQAMLPLLLEAPAPRIVNVSSGVGSLTRNADPAFPWRSIFGPNYPASKTALNAITLAMAIELESTGIKVNAACPGFTKTNLNDYAGTQTVEEGAREPVRLALWKTRATIGVGAPPGSFGPLRPFRDFCTHRVTVQEFPDLRAVIRRVRIAEGRQIIPQSLERPDALVQQRDSLRRGNEGFFARGPERVLRILLNDLQRL